MTFSCNFRNVCVSETVTNASEGIEDIIESLRRNKAVLVLFNSRSRNVKKRLLASSRLCHYARIISASSLRIVVKFYIDQKLLRRCNIG
jgi:hypothetical protein